MMRERVLVAMSVCAAGWLGCKSEKKAEPAETTQVSAPAAGNQPGPVGGRAPLDEAMVQAHMKTLGELKGCSARAEELFCGVLARFDGARHVGELPEQSTLWLGLSVFVPTAGEPKAAKLDPRAISMGLNMSEASKPALKITPILAKDPGNQAQVKGMARQVLSALEQGSQSPQVVVHDAQLLAYLRDQPKLAKHALTPQPQGWRMEGGEGEDALLFRVGESWVSVHRERARPDKPEGVWLSVYVEPELTGQVVPTADVDLAQLEEQFKCTSEPERAECVGLKAFGEGISLEQALGELEGVRMYFGSISGGAQQGVDSEYGAVMLRAGKAGGVEVAFSAVGSTSEQEEQALKVLAAEIEAGKVPGESPVLAYLSGVTRRPGAFGELPGSEGTSSLVARQGLFRGAPEARTTSYFRGEPGGERVRVLTHDHLSGQLWSWTVHRVKSKK